MQQQFRDAMAHLASAVSIITSNGEAGKFGLTVSSVTSVTDTPATLLFCVNQSSELHEPLIQNGRACVNVLAPEHEALAKHFAGMLGSSMGERFDWHDWENCQNGQPKLSGAVANLSGKITDTHTVGTHTIFILEIDEIDIKPNDSLTYFARQFKAVEI